eukprot:1156265-Pelagomonas_calceolata.AAC.8
MANTCLNTSLSPVFAEERILCSEACTWVLGLVPWQYVTSFKSSSHFAALVVLNGGEWFSNTRSD